MLTENWPPIVSLIEFDQWMMCASSCTACTESLKGTYTVPVAVVAAAAALRLLLLCSAHNDRFAAAE